MGLRNCWVFYFLLVSVVIFMCNADGTEKMEDEVKEVGEFVGRMIEQGRSMVHHVFKRFMIILPAIFFKLGIAFTMLVLVAIASVNNGFIGFLLLVVGLSSVLARLQDVKKAAALPLVLPPVHHHPAIHHGWDRTDKRVEERTEKVMTQAYPSQQYAAYPPLSTYNQAYYGQNR